MVAPRLPAELKQPAADARGLLVAVAVMGTWFASVALLIQWVPSGLGWALVPLAMAWQTWLFTGLFITAHDAMHGTVAPGRPRLNDAVGRLATRLYAFFSFDKMRAAHRLHHAAPATVEDPDWHDGKGEHPVRWFLVFLSHYLRPQQILFYAVAFNVLRHVVGLPLLPVLLFWIVPSILSTFQLFPFGTWLPHRLGPHGHDNVHRARSSGWPEWLSFLTCFHFGYHFAHHAWPGLPWWRLPRAERVLREAVEPSRAPVSA